MFFISEGTEKKGAESAMMKAGFVWYFHGKLIKRDSRGKLIKFPLQ